ncbi:MAG: hypothetical protein P1V51_05605 [Deltaproteobacteria bacterium]|nr:hypothetical protein [Deltaproteobacteria bacterium]
MRTPATIGSLLLALLLLEGCGGPVLYLPGEGCGSDVQCKGERICHEGQCVFPSEVGLDGGVDGGPDGGPDGGSLDAGTSAIGDACQSTADCQQAEGAVCYTEEDTFGTFVGGYCSAECGPNTGLECPAGGVCGLIFGTGGACLKACGGDDDCREGYVCSSFLGPLACVPANLAP